MSGFTDQTSDAALSSVSGLMAGTATISMPTRAQMIANRVPACVQTIATSGFATTGDGGGATYVRATGPLSDGSSFRSADGQWWLLSMTDVTVAMFGAIGGPITAVGSYSTLPDDTTAIQNAVTYCVANGVPLGVGPRFYRFTKSINAGKATPFGNPALRIVGYSAWKSCLIADLTENYPAFDLTNQNRGSINSLWITSTTTSQHSCVLLFAETQGSGVNLFVMRDVTINDFGASSKMAMFGWTADQMNIDNSSIWSASPNALCAAYFGLINHGGITSKFYTIAESDADGTLFLSHNGQFMCGTGPGLWVEGFNQVTLNGCYLNVGTIYGQITTGHTAGMLRLASSTNVSNGGQRFLTASLTGCRFEDQASNNLPSSPRVVVTGSIAPNADGMTSTLTVTATTTGALAVGNLLTGTGVAAGTTVLANVSANVWTVTNNQTVASTSLSSFLLSSPAVYVQDAIYESRFEGNFNTSGAGIFGGPGQQVDSTVRVSATANNCCFNNAGALIGGDYHFNGGANNVGLFDQTNSRQYRIGGRIGSSIATIMTAIGGTADDITDLSSIEAGQHFTNWMRSEKRVFMPYANAPTNYRLALKGESGAGSYYANYTGGSGLVTIGNFLTALPGALRYTDDASFQTLPFYELEIIGTFAAGMASGTTLNIAVQQALPGGTKYSTLVSLAAIPAYGAVTWWRAVVRFLPSIGNGLAAWSTLEALGTAGISNFGLSALTSGGFDITQNVPFTINILVNSPSNNPLTSNGFLYRIK